VTLETGHNHTAIVHKAVLRQKLE